MYVLKSEKDKKFYYGYTRNLRKRLEMHNSGRVKSTKSRIPLKIVYFEQVFDKESAIKREKYFKSGFGRKYIKRKLLAPSSNG